MKDYTANIIDYRGGKALLLDSLDILHMTSRLENKQVLDLIKEKYDEVDYILLITSMPFHTLRPKIRELFKHPAKSQINCYRHITPKGMQTWTTYLEEQTQEQTESLKILRLGEEKEK